MNNSLLLKIFGGLIAFMVVLFLFAQIGRNASDKSKLKAQVSYQRAYRYLDVDSAVSARIKPILDSLARERQKLEIKLVEKEAQLQKTKDENAVLTKRLDAARVNAVRRPRF